MGFSFKQAAPPPIQAPPVPSQMPKPKDAQDALGNSGIVDLVKSVGDDSTQSHQDRALTLQMVAQQATEAEHKLAAAPGEAKKATSGDKGGKGKKRKAGGKLPGPKQAVDDYFAPNRDNERGKRTATIVASYIPLVGGLLSKGGDLALDQWQDPEQQHRREEMADGATGAAKKGADDFFAPNRDSERGKRSASLVASYIPLVGGLASKGTDLALDKWQDPEEQHRREDAARDPRGTAARVAEGAAGAAKKGADDFFAPNRDNERGKRTATIVASYIPLVGGLLSKGGDLALDHLQDPEEQQQREDDARAAQEEAARVAQEAQEEAARVAEEAARAAEEARRKAEEEARNAAQNAGSQAQSTGQQVVNTVSGWHP